MIVPMKKVSLIVIGDQKKQALKKLRTLGAVHIEISEGFGKKLNELKESISLIESSIFAVSEKTKKNGHTREADIQKALQIAKRIAELTEENKALNTEVSNLNAELERLKSWGEINPQQLKELLQKGIGITLYQMPLAEYQKLSEDVKTIVLSRTKSNVSFAAIQTSDSENERPPDVFDVFRVEMPKMSTEQTKQKIDTLLCRIQQIDEELCECSEYSESMKKAICALQKDVEFETYATGMSDSKLSEDDEKQLSVAYFKGYIPTDDVEKLKAAASQNSWGLAVEDPTPDDDVPTKLKNNKFVSLIYPLTDFLGTVPGYFEYDISGWFLAFILIFFGIIFGDGGYGLLICAVAGGLIGKSLVGKKKIPPAFLLVALFGLSTVVWGTLTCTWFGLAPEMLPSWLKSLSVPVISNVYADKIWYPFWTNGEYGLTTAQNLQILCFSLALVQLTAAHIKGALRNFPSLKTLGDIGSVLQLVGIFYVVLSLVVNSKVFSLGLTLGSVPVGTAAIAMVGVGFAMSFIFSNYEGNVVKSVLESLKNIVSVLLGVVNVFSDIVSYIRLWAVGLAGAAISATVNELAGPLFGNFMFMVLAIILLVFGHGLNMILNVLSVIVHGIRLNTLEFSSHLDMSWSGHKYKPFEE